VEHLKKWEESVRYDLDSCPTWSPLTTGRGFPRAILSPAPRRSHSYSRRLPALAWISSLWLSEHWAEIRWWGI